MVTLRCRRATASKEETLSSITFHYLAEGAANIVFRIVPRDEATYGLPYVLTGPRNHLYGRRTFSGCVLRISKGREKTLTAERIKQDFEEVIYPSFEVDHKPEILEYLMSLTLVELDESVMPQLNGEIAAHATRYTGTIPVGTNGLIMEDMSSRGDMGYDVKHLTIEMKPKWLAQSPNAPLDAARCRNCALMALRNSEGKAALPYICPLLILEKSTKNLDRFLSAKVYSALRHVGLPYRNSNGNVMVKAILSSLVQGGGRTLVEHLVELQTTLDPIGVLRDPDPDHLRRAMTLRDCSVFIEVDMCPGKELEVHYKLADLDLKSEEKIEDWKEKELELIKGGWYQSRGRVPGGLWSQKDEDEDCGYRMSKSYVA